MTSCNAENCKWYMEIAFNGVSGLCVADYNIMRIDNDTDDMTCKTFEYKKKERLDGSRQKDIS